MTWAETTPAASVRTGGGCTGWFPRRYEGGDLGGEDGGAQVAPRQELVGEVEFVAGLAHTALRVVMEAARTTAEARS